MKIILLLMIMLNASANAQAVVADSFKCQIQITEKDNLEESMKQDFVFYLVRFPLSASPAPNVRLTAAFADGRAEMRNNLRTITANLTFDYQHGTKLDSLGQVVEARQKTCLALTADWCAEGNGSCSETKFNCLSSIDPFNPTQGWSVVNFAADGTPFFDQKTLIPYSITFKDAMGVDRGTATVTCEYKGSYQ